MTVAQLLQNVRLRSVLPPALANRVIEGVAYDSRKAGPGSLFFAFAGARVDGRVFAQQAIDKGAVAIVSELPAAEGLSDIWIEVEHGRKALAVVSGRFYGHPDKRIPITGITGT